MRFFGALILLLVAAPAWAERIIDLPELTAGRFYLTIITNDPPTAADAALTQFMATNPTMAAARKQVVYHVWDDNTPLVKDTSWKTFLGNSRPAVLLQATASDDGTANVVFFATGEAVQTSTMAAEMQLAVDSYAARNHIHRPGQVCPDGGRCPILPRVPLPRPYPQPQPVPQPVAPVTPPPAVQPLIPTIAPPAVDEKKPVEDDSGIPIWLFALPLIGAGAGLYNSFKD